MLKCEDFCLIPEIKFGFNPLEDYVRNSIKTSIKTKITRGKRKKLLVIPGPGVYIARFSGA